MPRPRIETGLEIPKTFMMSSSLPGRGRRRDAYEPSGAGNLAPRGRVIDKYIVVPAQSRQRRFAQDLPVQIFAARDDFVPAREIERRSRPFW
jgi:hypothetical protein